jgi:hypothetical protein
MFKILDDLADYVKKLIDKISDFLEKLDGRWGKK